MQVYDYNNKKAMLRIEREKIPYTFRPWELRQAIRAFRDLHCLGDRVRVTVTGSWVIHRPRRWPTLLTALGWEVYQIGTKNIYVRDDKGECHVLPLYQDDPKLGWERFAIMVDKGGAF